jgi:hypothetical protein
MLQSIQDYLLAANDDDAPLVPNESLQKWDNYCTYSIVCVDKKYSKHVVETAGLIGAGLANYSQPIITDTETIVKGDHVLAIDTFTTSAIPINFFDYVDQYHGQ